MTGKLIMLAPRLVRDVRVEIGADWLISEISKPEGKVRAEQVQGFTIEKRRCLFRRMMVVWLETEERKIEFYRSQSSLDIGLLLDELVAKIGEGSRALVNC